MFVLCGECENHYDDTAQSEECAGIGVKASYLSGGGTTSHQFTGTRPVEEHRTLTERANIAHATGACGVAVERSRPMN